MAKLKVFALVLSLAGIFAVGFVFTPMYADAQNIVVTPNSLNFGNATVGGSGVTATFTAQELDGVPSVLQVVDNTNSAVFTCTNNCNPTVAALGTEIIEFTFNPPSVGSHSAVISFCDQPGPACNINTQNINTALGEGVPAGAAPTVTMKANGFTGAIGVVAGTAVTLSWETTNMPVGSTCSASGDWGGNKPTPSGNENTPALAPGNYSYTLTCTNISGSESDTVSVTAAGAGPQQLTLTVNGPGKVSGDQGQITDCTGTCTGTYPMGTVVTLTATPNPGQVVTAWTGDCSGAGPTCTVTMSALKFVNVFFGTALTANAGPDDSITLPTTTYNLDGSVSGNTGPVTYSWLVDSTPPGGSATFNNAAIEDPSVTFSPVTGTYILSLTVAEGASTHTDTVTITVLPAGATPPTADFTFSVSGQDVTVTDASTPGSPGTLVPGGTWAWDWGDGTGVTLGQGPHTHSYASAGTYSIKLTVTDSAGFSDSDTQAVTVGGGCFGGAPDGVINGAEQCDPGPPPELGGETCSSQGSSGTGLSCTASCTFDISTCSGGLPGVIPIQNPLTATSFTDLINRIIDFIFTIAVIVAPILLVVAGVIFMTAAGDPNRVATARRMLLWTIVGFGVILISKGLVEVLKGILGL